MSEQGDRDALVEVLTHGYAIDSNVGGVCPACDHVYFERPPGAYMDPDLDWLRGAIQEHRIDALAQRDRRVAAEALREAVDEAPHCTETHCLCNTASFANWLRERADRIEGGE